VVFQVFIIKTQPKNNTKNVSSTDKCNTAVFFNCWEIPRQCQNPAEKGKFHGWV